MMNGHKEALTIATSAESPDAGRPTVAAADLKLMVSFFSTNACRLVLPTAFLPSNGP